MTQAPSQCHDCPAEILWATTVGKGVPMPLDAEPNAEGNVVLDTQGSRLLATVLGPLELDLLAPEVERYMPHHATCPGPRGAAARRGA